MVRLSLGRRTILWEGRARILTHWTPGTPLWWGFIVKSNSARAYLLSSDSWQPHELNLTGSSVRENFQARIDWLKEWSVYYFLQGLLPTQGSFAGGSFTVQATRDAPNHQETDWCFCSEAALNRTATLLPHRLLLYHLALDKER